MTTGVDDTAAPADGAEKTLAMDSPATAVATANNDASHRRRSRGRTRLDIEIILLERGDDRLVPATCGLVNGNHRQRRRSASRWGKHVILEAVCPTGRLSVVDHVELF